LMKERGGDTGIDALGAPLAVGSQPALVAAGAAHLSWAGGKIKGPIAIPVQGLREGGRSGHGHRALGLPFAVGSEPALVAAGAAHLHHPIHVSGRAELLRRPAKALEQPLVRMHTARRDGRRGDLPYGEGKRVRGSGREA
jgi:hypothetical protein